MLEFINCILNLLKIDCFILNKSIKITKFIISFKNLLLDLSFMNLNNKLKIINIIFHKYIFMEYDIYLFWSIFKVIFIHILFRIIVKLTILIFTNDWYSYLKYIFLVKYYYYLFNKKLLSFRLIVNVDFIIPLYLLWFNEMFDYIITFIKNYNIDIYFNIIIKYILIMLISWSLCIVILIIDLDLNKYLHKNILRILILFLKYPKWRTISHLLFYIIISLGLMWTVIFMNSWMYYWIFIRKSKRMLKIIIKSWIKNYYFEILSFNYNFYINFYIFLIQNIKIIIKPWYFISEIFIKYISYIILFIQIQIKIFNLIKLNKIFLYSWGNAVKLNCCKYIVVGQQLMEVLVVDRYQQLIPPLFKELNIEKNKELIPPLFKELFSKDYDVIINNNELITNNYYLLIPDIYLLFIIISLFIYILLGENKKIDLNQLKWIIIINLITISYYYYINVNLIAYLDLYIIIFNPLISLIKLIMLILIIILLLLNKNNEEIKIDIIFIMLISLIGAFIMISSKNIMIMLIGLEILTLSLYILVSSKKNSNKVIEAGLKYYIYGALASILILIGTVMIYSEVGSLEYNSIFIIILMSSEKNFLGYITVLIGFLYKMALFPYYWWFDDILSGSSNIITFFLALIPKLPLVYLIYEWYILFLYIYQFEIIYYMSIITIIWTAILTLYQTKIKKLLAYSSILHSSMVLLTISIESGYIWTNIAISLLYLFTYISTTLGLILILILIKKTNITELKWDKGINVTIRLFISLILITLAGIPPFICFYLKLLTFYLLAQNGHYYVLITLLLLTSISLIYYIRLIRLIFFNIEEDKQLLWQEKWDSIIIQILILSIIMNITFLIWGIPIYIKLITLSYISLS